MELEKVVRKISAYCKEKYKGNQRFAFFHDANNDLQVVCIICCDNIYGIDPYKYRILSFNTKCERTGFINFEIDSKNVYLSEVYTMTKQRGKGIAKELNYIMEYYLQSFNREYLYGIFSPQQMSEDLKWKIDVSEEELESRARHFYESNGFTVMDRDPFNDGNDDEYIIDFNDSYFDICSMFMASDNMSVVFKRLSTVTYEDKYHLEGDFLIQNGLEDEQVKTLIDKEKKKEDKLKSLLLSFGWSESKVERFIVLDKEFCLLNEKKINDRKLPRDLVLKIKEVTSGNRMNVEDIYSTLYEIYVSLKERGIVVKR